MTDQTFEAWSAYGSERWCATYLGKSLPWFRANRAILEREGFPKVDALIGLTCKRDVDAWIEKRRKVADAVPVAPYRDHHGDMQPRIPYDDL